MSSFVSPVHLLFQSTKIKNFENNACIGVRDYDILLPFLFGGIAQLVERLNGIQKVRGSTPLTSTIKEEMTNETGFARLFLC